MFLVDDSDLLSLLPVLIKAAFRREGRVFCEYRRYFDAVLITKPIVLGSQILMELWVWDTSVC